MRPVACPICDRKDAPLWVEEEAPALGRLRLVRCPGCGLGYLDPQPDPDELAPFYARDYYGGESAKFEPFIEAMRDRLARRRAAGLLQGLPVGARVLDVGCGDGRLLAAFAALGCEGVGTERRADHPRAGAAARGAEILAGDLTDLDLPAARFDLCVYWHVLEHLHDPAASLIAAGRALRPGGRLVVAVPHLDSVQARWARDRWFHLDLPRHLFHFTPESLAALLVRTGFRVTRISHFCLEQNPFGLLQSALNRRAAGEEGNALYEILKGTRRDAQFARRLLYRVAFALGMPVAVALATIESMAGRGGTIEVWASTTEGVGVAEPVGRGRPSSARTSAAATSR